MAEYTVKQGDTLASIASEHKIALRSLLYAPENEELLRTRSPEQLFEGDTVFVPDEPPKSVTLQTDRVYTFVVRPAMMPLQVRFLCGGAPRALEPCSVGVDGADPVETSLDRDGWLRIEVPVAARRLVVTFFPGCDDAQETTVLLGHLDPVTETRGIQQRLNNLGFACGAEDGDAAERTKSALRAFQATMGEAAPTGMACSQTGAALTNLHRS